MYDKMNLTDQYRYSVQTKMYWFLFFQKLDMIFTLYHDDLLESFQFVVKDFNDLSCVRMDEEKTIYAEIDEENLISKNEKEITLPDFYINKLKTFLLEIKKHLSNFIYPNFYLYFTQKTFEICSLVSTDNLGLRYYCDEIREKEQSALHYFMRYKLFRSINCSGALGYGFFAGFKIDTLKFY